MIRTACALLPLLRSMTRSVGSIVSATMSATVLRTRTITLSSIVALGLTATSARADIPEPIIDVSTLLIRGTAAAGEEAAGRLVLAGYDAVVKERLDSLEISIMQVAPAKGSGIDAPDPNDILAAVAGIAPPQGLVEVGFAYIFGAGGGQTGSLWVTRQAPYSNGEFRGQYGAGEIGLTVDGLPSSGRGVIVAVLDSGVVPVGDLARVALPVSIDTFSGAIPSPGAPTADPGGDGIDSDNDGVLDEFVGHGSFVGSLIALTAPEAKQLHVRCVDSDGQTNTVDIARGIQAAINAGAHVINLSIVVPDDIPHLGAIVNQARQRGITVVASAGNFPSNVLTYPGSYPSVGSIGSSVAGLAFSTSFATYNPSVDFCAPGETQFVSTPFGTQPVDGASIIGIIGADPANPQLPRYATATGSSFSCAWAAGAAALVRSGHPEWPNAKVALVDIGDAVINRLRATTGGIDIPPGYRGLVGTGILDCVGACAFIAPGSIPVVTSDVDPAGGVYRIDGADLAAVLSAWGPVPTGRISYADLDGNGSVDGADLAIVLSLWTVSP